MKAIAGRLSELIHQGETDHPPTRFELEKVYGEIVDKIVSELAHVREMSDASLYMELEGSLAGVDSDLRESIQAVTRKAMWKIIVKLRGTDEISEPELELIRIWVVGEADAYVQEEHHYKDWLTDLDRLEGAIDQLRDAPIGVESLEELRGLLTDARANARSLGNYLNYRERAQHFEQTVNEGLDSEDRNTLADILAYVAACLVVWLREHNGACPIPAPRSACLVRRTFRWVALPDCKSMSCVTTRTITCRDRPASFVST